MGMAAGFTRSHPHIPFFLPRTRGFRNLES